MTKYYVSNMYYSKTFNCSLSITTDEKLAIDIYDNLKNYKDEIIGRIDEDIDKKIIDKIDEINFYELNLVDEINKEIPSILFDEPTLSAQLKADETIISSQLKTDDPNADKTTDKTIEVYFKNGVRKIKSNFKYISIDIKNIEDFKSVENFKNLEKLTLYFYNDVIFPTNKYITNLCINNFKGQVNIINNFPNLKFLEIVNSDLSNANTDNVKFLTCNDCTNFKGGENTKHLYIRNTTFSNQYFPKSLEVIRMHNCELKSVDLSEHKIEELDIVRCGLEDIKLSKNIVHLNLNYNNLKNIETEHCNLLKRCHLKNNKLEKTPIFSEYVEYVIV